MTISVENMNEGSDHHAMGPVSADLLRAEYEHRTANLLQFVCSNLARSARRAQEDTVKQAIQSAAEQVTGVGRLLR